MDFPSQTEACFPRALPRALRLPLLTVLYLTGARATASRRLAPADLVALCAMVATAHVLSTCADGDACDMAAALNLDEDDDDDDDNSNDDINNQVDLKLFCFTLP